MPTRSEEFQALSQQKHLVGSSNSLASDGESDMKIETEEEKNLSLDMYRLYLKFHIRFTCTFKARRK